MQIRAAEISEILKNKLRTLIQRRCRRSWSSVVCR